MGSRAIRRVTTILTTFAVGSLACGSAPGTPSEADVPITVTRLRPEPASFTYSSGLKEPRRIVVRDQAAWRDIWTSIWRGHSPEPPLPEIDFGREMVVVAALGERPTGGYSIFIDSASEGPAGVTIRIRSVSPGAGCVTTQALTQPVDIARLPRRDGALAFVERVETQECR